jgi:hypothetical protein
MKSVKMPRHNTGNRSGLQWRQELLEQVRNWQSARPDQRYLTDRGVPVIRRHKRRVVPASPGAGEKADALRP